jgi:hypothetical protein
MDLIRICGAGPGGGGLLALLPEFLHAKLLLLKLVQARSRLISGSMGLYRHGNSLTVLALSGGDATIYGDIKRRPG